MMIIEEKNPQLRYYINSIDVNQWLLLFKKFVRNDLVKFSETQQYSVRWVEETLVLQLFAMINYRESFDEISLKIKEQKGTIIFFLY